MKDRRTDGRQTELQLSAGRRDGAAAELEITHLSPSLLVLQRTWRQASASSSNWRGNSEAANVKGCKMITEFRSHRRMDSGTQHKRRPKRDQRRYREIHVNIGRLNPKATSVEDLQSTITGNCIAARRNLGIDGGWQAQRPHHRQLGCGQRKRFFSA